MRRGTGCGQAVSVWAARCPGCGRGTDDAELVPEVVAEEIDAVVEKEAPVSPVASKTVRRKATWAAMSATTTRGVTEA